MKVQISKLFYFTIITSIATVTHCAPRFEDSEELSSIEENPTSTPPQYYPIEVNLGETIIDESPETTNEDPEVPLPTTVPSFATLSIFTTKAATDESSISTIISSLNTIVERSEPNWFPNNQGVHWINITEENGSTEESNNDVNVINLPNINWYMNMTNGNWTNGNSTNTNGTNFNSTNVRD